MRRFLAAGGLALSLFAAAPAGAETMRPALGKPLIAAKQFLAQKQYAKAMAQVRAADAVPGKTADEQLTVDRMRAAIANSSGDTATAAGAYTRLINSPGVSQGEKLTLMAALSGVYYRNKNYADAAGWAEKYLRAGGTDNNVRTLLIQSFYLGQNYKEAARWQAFQIAQESRNGRAPSEDHLQLLYSCQTHLNDTAGAFETIKKLVTYYPKPDYWLNVISTIQRKPGFADRLLFDLQRLEFALGLINKPSDAMEMAQLALQAKLGGEAKDIVDRSYAGGLLGTGPEAARQQRLRDLVNKTAAAEQAAMGKDDADAATDRDGNRLLALGEQYVSFGNTAKGIPMMEQAIRKDQLRHAEDAKLHLALAYLKTGDKARAVAAFKTVGGKDGTADLAQLWLLFLASKK